MTDIEFSWVIAGAVLLAGALVAVTLMSKGRKPAAAAADGGQSDSWERWRSAAAARRPVYATAAYLLLFCCAAVAAALSFHGLVGFGRQNLRLSGGWEYLVPFGLDGAAMFSAVIAVREASHGDASLGSRLLVWAFAGAAAWFNWVHAPRGDGATPERRSSSPGCRCPRRSSSTARSSRPAGPRCANRAWCHGRCRRSGSSGGCGRRARRSGLVADAAGGRPHPGRGGRGGARGPPPQGAGEGCAAGSSTSWRRRGSRRWAATSGSRSRWSRPAGTVRSRRRWSPVRLPADGGRWTPRAAAAPPPRRPRPPVPICPVRTAGSNSLEEKLAQIERQFG